MQKARFVIALLFAVAHLAQLLAPVPLALAVTMPNSIVINEVYPGTGTVGKWVELYNTTDYTIDVSNWRLVRGSGTFSAVFATGATIAAHGFLVREATTSLPLDGGTTPLRLLDGPSGVEVSTATWPTIVSGQSYARTTDGGGQWQAGQPTKGAANIAPVDTTPPSVPVSGWPNREAQTTHDFEFSWQPASDTQSANIRYEVRASLDADQVGGAADTSTAWYSPLQNNRRFVFRSIDNARDGTWYWQVRATDDAGNRSGWSDVWRVTVDTKEPVITLSEPEEGRAVGGPSGRVNFSAVIDDANEIAEYSILLDKTDVTSQVQRSSQSTVGHLVLTGSIDANDLEDGTHAIAVNARDAYGHAASAVRSVVLDATAPLLVPALAEEQVLAGKVQLQLDATELHPWLYEISIVDHENRPVPLEENEASLASKDTTVHALERSWDTGAVVDGFYTVRFFGKDIAGNEATLLRTVRVANAITPGAGAVVVPPAVDSLLDQLSKQLIQPFVVPDNNRVAAHSLARNVVGAQADTDSGEADEVQAKDEASHVPMPIVAPSTEGWRIFGVAWYWWLSIMAIVGVMAYRLYNRRIQQVAV